MYMGISKIYIAVSVVFMGVYKVYFRFVWVYVNTRHERTHTHEKKKEKIHEDKLINKIRPVVNNKSGFSKADCLVVQMLRKGRLNKIICS